MVASAKRNEEEALKTLHLCIVRVYMHQEDSTYLYTSIHMFVYVYTLCTQTYNYSLFPMLRRTAFARSL